jgi:hypothetical protein
MVQTNLAMNYYDEKNGWEHTKPGWHEVVIPARQFRETVFKHTEMLTWIYDNIGKCEHHCRWQFDNDSLKYKFRYERDYIWFKLTWG